MTKPNTQPPVINNRYDIFLLFDVENGNPNGDPDNSSYPRIENETGHGLMTDACIKRKIRNVIFDVLRPNTPGFDLYVRHDRALEESREIALAPHKDDPRLKDDKQRALLICERCVDIRMFGAALGITNSADINLLGPIQISMARTFDEVSPQSHTITRMARDKASDDKSNRQIGSKTVLPYALFGVKIFINPNQAKNTGLTQDDVELFKEALQHMFRHDMSSMRGLISPRLCVAFKHESSLGNAHAHTLFERVSVTKKVEGFPASYGDYDVTVNEDDLPRGITLERWI